MACGRIVGHGDTCSGDASDPYLCEVCKLENKIAMLEMQASALPGAHAEIVKQRERAEVAEKALKASRKMESQLSKIVDLVVLVRGQGQLPGNLVAALVALNNQQIEES